jgi:hypothetical protein
MVPLKYFVTCRSVMDVRASAKRLRGAIHGLNTTDKDCFAEPVIGRAFARPLVPRNDENWQLFESALRMTY